MAELRAQLATEERENAERIAEMRRADAERIARMRREELEAQIAVEIAHSNSNHSSRAPSNNNGARPSVPHAGGRATARADATQLRDTISLQMVQSEPLLATTLPITVDTVRPIGSNGILPTSANMDGQQSNRPPTSSRAGQDGSQAVRNHSGDQS